jgi:hypothetical protein
MSAHTITIYGASDDLIEIEGEAAGCDEYPADDADSGSFVLIGTDDRQLRVRVSYGHNGVWVIALSPVDEDVPALTAVVSGSGYSARATIDDVISVIHEHRGE